MSLNLLPYFEEAPGCLGQTWLFSHLSPTLSPHADQGSRTLSFSTEWTRLGHLARTSIQHSPNCLVREELQLLVMTEWPAKHSIFISRCFWDYYLHVFQKLYALELAARPNAHVTWFDPPTRNPLTWLREPETNNQRSNGSQTLFFRNEVRVSCN